MIAPGAWSRRPLNDIGAEAPLKAERGYNSVCGVLWTAARQLMPALNVAGD